MTARYRVIIVICVALLVLVRGEQRIVSSGDAVGSLVVHSDPAGATVYVDGRFAGQTPLTLATIAAGEHRVQLARAGYRRAYGWSRSRLARVQQFTQLTAARRR
jgi:hypothetical protein